MGNEYIFLIFSDIDREIFSYRYCRQDITASVRLYLYLFD